MSLSGSLLFCTDCGNLLNRVSPKVENIKCEICDTENKNQWPLEVQTTSRPDAFPSVLRNKRDEIQKLDTANIETWARTSEACPSCKNSETFFREMQLRGADEGSTVFFRCSQCSHKWKLDN
ncbi:hypothetical protein BU25DRAFT_87265 [Macroventuria anomochaeta]|uniref:Uncharacterized protein n=1 Tax=Macroventuria anomochaeta TaxID=301207 RepID=A0ACB6SI82_9PLEO|nr:uncharacterized protein BU25DRAFT_87265 [Macroventuria anomochaeta]KAF2632994.1 hypothetical protein BU25DRAFT_87265 [Macroventuria anomochaeta]